MALRVSVGTQAALGVAATSVVIGAYARGVFGDGIFAIQLANSIGLLCLLPVLVHVGKRVHQAISVTFALVVVAPSVVPVLHALLINLFTGHRAADTADNPLAGIWRVFAILGLWIAFAKVNETYIRPWLRTLSIFKPGENTVNAHTSRIAHGKREAALEAIKERLRPVIVKRKIAEKGLKQKKTELEKAVANLERSSEMVKKAEARLEKANEDSADYADLTEQVEGLQAMEESARAYQAAIEGQIATHENDIKECTAATERMQKEWTEALHINNHVEFYR